MSHAYVRFEIDKTFYITKVSDIKNFKFKNKEDFDKQKLFEVLWTDGHYYNAQIVLLSVMKPLSIPTRRLEFDAISLGEEVSDSMDDDKQCSVKKVSHTSPKQKNPLRASDTDSGNKNNYFTSRKIDDNLLDEKRSSVSRNREISNSLGSYDAFASELVTDEMLNAIEKSGNSKLKNLAQLVDYSDSDLSIQDSSPQKQRKRKNFNFQASRNYTKSNDSRESDFSINDSPPPKHMMEKHSHSASHNYRKTFSPAPKASNECDSWENDSPPPKHMIEKHSHSASHNYQNTLSPAPKASSVSDSLENDSPPPKHMMGKISHSASHNYRNTLSPAPKASSVSDSLENDSPPPKHMMGKISHSASHNYRNTLSPAPKASSVSDSLESDSPPPKHMKRKLPHSANHNSYQKTLSPAPKASSESDFSMNDSRQPKQMKRKHSLSQARKNYRNNSKPSRKASSESEIEVDSMSSVAEKPGTSKSSQLKKKKRHTNSQSSLTFRKASKRYKMDSEHSGGSDNDVNEQNDELEKFAIVSIRTENNRKVEKIHLGHDVFIKHESWKLIQKEKKDSLYVKNLATCIWTRQKLANRCVEYSEDLISIPNRSPRKLLTPKKMKVVEGCFKKYINKKNEAKRLSKMNYYVSQQIGYLRRTLYPETIRRKKIPEASFCSSVA
ncbi:uncharacterized protein LOC127286549 isoform X5 [Leptopilina boulardi]|uniref:uncharacterized protein LOC127284285 isoform X4 n=1 Tax=Leptopilina boulardi TaxID=63433 RepID=UPI0021F651D8|nr:uncharacterized protein LOC127284285 isoform X4 [Leptopilina boulardi]XP_051165622.1 uncharacterized protein LOC127284285 isoform X5 [Leptopilina boulardi]XP_051168971.1 uncharacterized protein LOC127286549 isoform X4 [Leptopilina boulardi]XP_051168972.1 uncharacterized protein LOC127286549 isoform X5 [Leptopilina boulardi]